MPIAAGAGRDDHSSPNQTATGAAAIEFGERRKLLLLLVLVLLLAIAGAVAMHAGTYDLSAITVAQVLTAHFSGSVDRLDRVSNTIVWEIRLPRILVAILVGFSLATAGTVYQGSFRNPLVEPFILGVSAGASFGAALAVLMPGLLLGVQGGAFVFALVAVAGAYFLSRSNGSNPSVSLILAGIIISSVFQSLVSIIKYTSDDSALRAIVFWIMGGLYYSGWPDVARISLIVLPGLGLVWTLGWRLNVLSMGDHEARTLGVNPDRLKTVLVIVATLMTAVAVASVGIIAWVGLMMPHAARMILGPDHRFVIPAAALLGGIYLLFCDTLARTLTNAEIPISIVTSVLGAPFLFYLLRTRGRLTISG